MQKLLFDRNQLKLFPNLPGVYIMKSGDGSILYVGKAKALQKRIRQYFLPQGDGREVIPYLIAKVVAIDTIVVSSEKEALLLENTLIKKHKPHYNVLLKDDKAYIALRINENEKWPYVSIFRYKGNLAPNATYFGPYTSADSARKTLDLLHKLFPLRQCSDSEFARRTRPCILYDMKQCIAPCVNRCTKDEYDTLVKRTIKFLQGKDKEVLKELYEEMKKASDGLDFENAAKVYKMIKHIERTLEGQNVFKIAGVDTDVIALYRQGDEVLLTQLIFRLGKLNGSLDFHFSNVVENDQELMEAFLLQHYQDRLDIPKEILIGSSLAEDNLKAIAEILSKEKRNLHLLVPKRGSKKNLVEMAYANAEANFKKKEGDLALREKVLLEMQERLKLSRYPRRIECFDNSNFSGTEVVSALASFYEGKKDSSRYRRYKIKERVESDDYAAMQEVLSRRFKRAKAEDDFPDLLIVDGGKSHLKIALKVLLELNILGAIDVVALAKEQGRHDKGATQELIYLPGIKDPIVLSARSKVLFLLQNIRDEAHRFAISYQRVRRSKTFFTKKKR